MFAPRYKPLRKEPPFVKYKGIFRRQISLFEAVALIVSVTIGAGVLGLPYAISKVGIFLGIFYIAGIGTLIIGLNLLLGSIAVNIKKEMQLVGFAHRYLGEKGKWLMTMLMYLLSWGVMVVYIIGEGEVLAELLGGSDFFWSIIFFVFITILIYTGLSTVKIVELILSIGILAVVLVLSIYSAPHVSLASFEHLSFANLLLPYGVLLFAFHGTTSIPEAHSILKDRDNTFKKAIIIAGVINILVYVIFAVVVVGVTGFDTTEIATIGLGEKLGPKVFLLGNIFALLAMGTSAIMVGVSMRDSLKWDFKLSRSLSTTLVCGIPFFVFVFGLRGFITAIDIVGGVFGSMEMLLILFIYWKAKQVGDLKVGKYKLHHTALLIILLLFALTIGAIYSIYNLF